MSTNKVLIIFSPAFPQNESDTVWLPSLQTFVTAINKNFKELTVIIFAFQYPYKTKIYKWHNNQVIPFNGMYKSKPQRLLMWLKILLAVKKIKRESDIIGIFSLWCGECTFIAKYISKFLKLHYLCWILGQDARASNTYVKRIKPKGTELIALSDFLAEEFYRSHGIKPSYIIPQGIDISLFKTQNVYKDIDIIGVGSLSILKQYDLFVKIIASLKIDMPGIRSMLCGDGEDRKHIAEMISEYELKENLEMKGLLQHEESLHMMQRAKILLHPSSYEGFPTACLESLYAGAHVISFVQPMHKQIRNWHIVKTVEEMRNKAFELLSDVNAKYKPMLAYSNNEAAIKVLQLFGYSNYNK